MKRSWLSEYQFQLSTQIRQNKLPHAILFAGVKGSGKDALAKWLVQVLLCKGKISVVSEPNGKALTYNILQACGHCKHCQLYHAGNFPDHKTIDNEKQTIGIDEVRQTNTFLQKTAQLSGSKTILIPKAQAMTESAANALLKTLEEPTEHSHLILLTPDPQRLLATIISRCRVITIRPSIDDLVADFPESNKRDAYQNLTHIAELSDKAMQDTYHAFNVSFSEFILNNSNRQELLLLLTEHSEGLRWLEKVFTDMIRCSYHWEVPLYVTLKDAIKNGVITVAVIHACHQIFLQSQKQLIGLVQSNKTFVLEKMLIDIKKQIIR